MGSVYVMPFRYALGQPSLRVADAGDTNVRQWLFRDYGRFSASFGKKEEDIKRALERRIEQSYGFSAEGSIVTGPEVGTSRLNLYDYGWPSSHCKELYDNMSREASRGLDGEWASLGSKHKDHGGCRPKPGSVPSSSSSYKGSQISTAEGIYKPDIAYYIIRPKGAPVAFAGGELKQPGLDATATTFNQMHQQGLAQTMFYLFLLRELMPNGIAVFGFTLIGRGLRRLLLRGEFLTIEATDEEVDTLRRATSAREVLEMDVMAVHAMPLVMPTLDDIQRSQDHLTDPAIAKPLKKFLQYQQFILCFLGTYGEALALGKLESLTRSHGGGFPNVWKADMESGLSLPADEKVRWLSAELTDTGRDNLERKYRSSSSPPPRDPRHALPASRTIRSEASNVFSNPRPPLPQGHRLSASPSMSSGERNEDRDADQPGSQGGGPRGEDSDEGNGGHGGADGKKDQRQGGKEENRADRGSVREIDRLRVNSTAARLHEASLGSSDDPASAVRDWVARTTIDTAELQYPAEPMPMGPPTDSQLGLVKQPQQHGEETNLGSEDEFEGSEADDEQHRAPGQIETEIIIRILEALNITVRLKVPEEFDGLLGECSRELHELIARHGS